MRDRKVFAHIVKARTRKRNGELKKWKPTTLLLGTRAVKRPQKIARCFAKTIIVGNLENKNMDYVNLTIGIVSDTAKNIKETTEMFRDVPTEIWNFNGPIDYIRVKSPGTARMINFHDEKRIQPSISTVVRFEYENSDGNKFYSEIKVERGSPTQQVYFLTPALVNSGKI